MPVSKRPKMSCRFFRLFHSQIILKRSVDAEYVYYQDKALSDNVVYFDEIE